MYMYMTICRSVVFHKWCFRWWKVFLAHYLNSEDLLMGVRCIGLSHSRISPCPIPEPMDVDRGPPALLDLPTNQVTILTGHESEVFTCAWSPSDDIIVSG